MFFTTSVFIFGETYFRFFVDTTDSFSINKISKRWSERYKHWNNRNLRDNIDYDYVRPKGKRRITILGDSFTAGHGIKDVEDRFGNRLRKVFPETEIHLIAGNGASSYSELEMMHNLYRSGYEFDIILLVYCLNDIDYFVMETKEVYGRISKFHKNQNFLQKNSYFINTLSFRMFAQNDPDFMNYANFMVKAYEGQEWEQQKRILKRIKQFTQQIQKPFMVVTFPFLSEPIESYTFKNVHPLIDQFWEEEDVPHLDLLEVFESKMGKHLTVNKYDAHPNEIANEIATKSIEQFLQEEAELESVRTIN